MVPDIYGDDVLGDLLDGDDDSLGFEYTEILGDNIPGHTTSFGDSIPGHTTSFGDLLDGDDESGAFVGTDDIIGAVRHRRRRANARKRAAAAMLMRKRIGAGALLRGVPPRQSREYALGLGSTSVAGNSSANINVQPQVIFRPERLVVPSNLAIDFLITDIKVGKNSQLVSTGALPAVMFTEVAFGVRLKMDTCQISMFVTISVTNQNPAARNFQGGIVGPAVE
jgi:hypothetical protein